MWVAGRCVDSHRLSFEHWVGGPVSKAKGRFKPGAGERHAGAKFSETQVKEIRFRAKNETRVSIAKSLGVSSQAIDKIVNRQTWKNK